MADQVFVASSRDITCVYCKQPTNFYTKNMSAHFMILGIQSNLTKTGKERPLVKEAIDGAVKACTFMIARNHGSGTCYLQEAVAFQIEPFTIEP